MKEALDLAGAKIRIRQLGQKQRHDLQTNAKSRALKVRDSVLLKRGQPSVGKFYLRWEGPYLITKQTSLVNYELMNNDTQQRQIVHINRQKLIAAKENVTSAKTEKEQKRMPGRPSINRTQLPKESYENEASETKPTIEETAILTNTPRQNTHETEQMQAEN